LEETLSLKGLIEVEGIYQATNRICNASRKKIYYYSKNELESVRGKI